MLHTKITIFWCQECECTVSKEDIQIDMDFIEYFDNGSEANVVICKTCAKKLDKDYLF